jgi:hypothetical protein
MLSLILHQMHGSPSLNSNCPAEGKTAANCNHILDPEKLQDISSTWCPVLGVTFELEDIASLRAPVTLLPCHHVVSRLAAYQVRNSHS